jgi:predicted nucleic acid-binding protein
MPALYLDTSAVLRTILEKGSTPEIEEQILRAPSLVTSRLTSIEASRALLRRKQLGEISEVKFVDAEHETNLLWTRCEFWEISRRVCELACVVAPTKLLRALDAIHLATFLVARADIPDLQLLTVDERLRRAAEDV